MDAEKTGALISRLRRERGLTQNEVAQKLMVCGKTVSKWETGKGFPDISLLSRLSDIFGVEVERLLSGELSESKQDGGNMKRTKFYFCEHCKNLITSTESGELSCCGRTLKPLVWQEPDEAHRITVEEADGEYYITFSHPMEKEHFLCFFSYVRWDRVLTVRLYPQQGGELRIPILRGGALYYYCTQHGLFRLMR